MAPEIVQSGIRIEKKLLKLMKALAELRDLSVSQLASDLIEDSFKPKKKFFSPVEIRKISELRKIYDIDYDRHAYRAFVEGPSVKPSGRKKDQYRPIERVQTGFRMEKQTLKILKTIAECNDMTPSQQLESIFLHKLENVDCYYERIYPLIPMIKKIFTVS